MQDLVKKLAEKLQRKEMTLVTAESCTGGMLASAITARPGSSKMFERGYVTYSNESKKELLGVSDAILKTHGAVSKECALAMAQGALKNSHADMSISITGIAGPEGDENKPVGLVYFGYALKDGASAAFERRFEGDRQSIREQSTREALNLLISVLEENA